MMVQIWFSGRGPEIYRHVEDVDVQEREVIRMTFHQPNPDGIVEILINFRDSVSCNVICSISRVRRPAILATLWLQQQW